MGLQNYLHDKNFQKKPLAKAAQEYRLLEIERGEWIIDSDISKIIRNAPWHCGKFIIEKFEFTNYFTYKRSLYFNKKDLLALKKELKKRNINLKDMLNCLKKKKSSRKN